MEYKTAIDLKDGRVIIFEVEKIGTKYIHGVIVHKGDQGQTERNYWTAKFAKSEHRFFDGARWDLKAMYEEYVTKKRDYDEKRQDYSRDTEREEHHKMYEVINAKMEQWDRENPEPENPLLEPLEICPKCLLYFCKCVVGCESHEMTPEKMIEG